MTDSMTPAEEAYERAADAVEPRALVLLGMLAIDFSEAGWLAAGVPYFLDETDDRFIWCVTLRKDGRPEALDVSVDLVKARAAAADPAPEDGVGLNLRVVREGGRPLLDWAGYNFARNLWVSASDPAALEGRWRGFERAVLDTSRWLPETLAFAERD